MTPESFLFKVLHLQTTISHNAIKSSAQRAFLFRAYQPLFSPENLPAVLLRKDPKRLVGSMEKSELRPGKRSNTHFKKFEKVNHISYGHSVLWAVLVALISISILRSPRKQVSQAVKHLREVTHQAKSESFSFSLKISYRE
jgi:hypothetical protein